jgi:hypothetical protein
VEYKHNAIPMSQCSDIQTTIPTIPKGEVQQVITQMCRDTKTGDLKWFTMAPGIGVGYGVASKESVYYHTEFWNYTGTIYDLNSEGKFSLRCNDLYGWIDAGLGEKLLAAIKGDKNVQTKSEPDFELVLTEAKPIYVLSGTGNCTGCGKIRGSGELLNGIPCECGYVPERAEFLLEEGIDA